MAPGVRIIFVLHDERCARQWSDRPDRSGGKAAPSSREAGRCDADEAHSVSVTSLVGTAQQISTVPSGGRTIGGVVYAVVPAVSRVTQTLQAPVRQSTGGVSPLASATSSSVPLLVVHVEPAPVVSNRTANGPGATGSWRGRRAGGGE